MKHLGLKPEKAKKPAYKPKPYEQATFPGQKVQIEVHCWTSKTAGREDVPVYGN